VSARTRRPRCLVIAGPNGAGKTAFAKVYLSKIADVIHFINADSINVPKADVIRRFLRRRENFERVYRALADSWAVYDNSSKAPRLLEKKP